MKKTIAFLASAFLMLMFVSCSKDIKSISFPGGQYYTIYVGHYNFITVELDPPDADRSLIEWTSSDPYVATVVGGVVTGISTGSATITARFGNVSASATVIVQDIDVNSFKVSTPVSVGPGGIAEVYVSDFDPDFADARNIKWSLVDGGNANFFQIFNVDEDRVYVKCYDTAKDGYKCELYGRNVSGSFHKSAIINCVYQPLQSLSMNVSTLATFEESEETISCTMNPFSPSTDVEIEWSSSNPEIATVKGEGTTAKIQALKEGKTTIMAKDKYTSKSTTCEVTVYFKRVIKKDCKLRLYSHAEEVVPKKLYKLSVPLENNSITLLPRAASPDYYIGLDDGYSISSEDMTVTCTKTPGQASDSGISTVRPYQCFIVDYHNNVSGNITLSIPNGSTYTLYYQTKVATVSMEKLSTSGNVEFTNFHSNVTTIPVGGTFTVKRPTSSTIRDYYTFCFNCKNEPLSPDRKGTTVANSYSVSVLYRGFYCEALSANNMYNDTFATIRNTSQTGTYVFRQDPSQTGGCDLSDITFTFVVQ